MMGSIKGIYRIQVGKDDPLEAPRLAQDVFKQPMGGLSQACLGIPHSSRPIAINVAKVTLPIHQRITHSKILRQAHHRIIHGTIPMRVVFTNYIPHHTGTFFKAFIGI